MSTTAHPKIRIKHYNPPHPRTLIIVNPKLFDTEDGMACMTFEWHSIHGSGGHTTVVTSTDLDKPHAFGQFDRRYQSTINRLIDMHENASLRALLDEMRASPTQPPHGEAPELFSLRSKTYTDEIGADLIVAALAQPLLAGLKADYYNTDKCPLARTKLEGALAILKPWDILPDRVLPPLDTAA